MKCETTMNCQPSKPTIRNFRTVQNSTSIRRLSKVKSAARTVVRSLTARLYGESSLATLSELGTDSEPAGNKSVSGWQDQCLLGKFGGLDPVKPDGISDAPLKTSRSHLICPTIRPILQLTHPLHPSWKRSRTLSMTCIIGGSFFMRSAQLLGMSDHTRPQRIEVQH